MAQPGDFLIRRSSKPGCYVLTVNSDGNAINFPITTEVSPETGARHILFGGSEFSCLRFLVRCLRLHAIAGPDGTPITLGLPAPLPSNDASSAGTSFMSMISWQPSGAQPEWFAGESSRGKVEAMVAAGHHGDRLCSGGQ